MFNRQKEMMVYVMLGFLEAGKTSIIQDLLTDELFDKHSKTLIIACEEGEEEYTPAFLAKAGAVCEVIDEEEEFTGERVTAALKKYKPDRIIIEYNGMWNTNHIPEIYYEIEDMLFDRDVIPQIIDIVNYETFNLYIKNMPSLMVEHFKVSEMVIVNRCTLETKRSVIRGSVKAANPRAQVVFESSDDAFYEMKEELPYDVNADVIDITDENFGVWYIDMIDNVKVYEGKTLKLSGLLNLAKGLEPGFAVFGRNAMTCCADDIQFMGFLCKAEDWKGLKTGDYITITARMEYKFMKEYEEEGPVFYAENVEKAVKPADDTVYFN